MKLSEFAAELKSLKETIASFIGDKTKATAEALSQFSTKLTALETVTAAELAQKTADLATAQQTIGTTQAALEKAQGEVNTLGGSLKAACEELKLEVKTGATSADMITSLKAGVSSTLAKLNVPAGNIPNGKPATTAGEAKVKTRADFAKLNPVEKMNFFKAGGRLTD